jgi:hypothetical protein
MIDGGSTGVPSSRPSLKVKVIQILLSGRPNDDPIAIDAGDHEWPFALGKLAGQVIEVGVGRGARAPRLHHRAPLGVGPAARARR